MAIRKLRRNIPLSRESLNAFHGQEILEHTPRVSDRVELVAHEGVSGMTPPESRRWDHFPEVSQEVVWKTCSPYFSVIQWWLPEVEGCCIGCHQLVSKLGQGSYGEVFASVGTDGRLTAVKVTSKSRLLSEEAIQAVTEECNFLSQLNHPNICALIGTINGVKNFYIFMEYAGSRTLYAILQRHGPLDFEQTEHIFPAIMQGVDHMHSRGVAHCDLKPGNIVISDEGTPKIVDFGLALRTGDQNIFGLRGTFPFIPPEAILAPRKAHDLAKGDIWALGVLLLEMICGVNKVPRMLGWERNVPINKFRVMQLVSFLNTPRALQMSIAPELGQAASCFASVLRSMMHCVPEERLDAEAARLMFLDKWKYENRSPFLHSSPTLLHF